MKDQINTIREALEAIDNGCQANNLEHTLAALTQLEAMVWEQESSLAFYKRRCDALQQWQSKMRDPERTVVCDILANGHTLEPAGDRYAAPVAQQPQEIEVQCPVCNHKFYEWPNDKQPQAEAVPPGYALVPVEPTPETLHAVRFAGDPDRPAIGERIVLGETAYPFVGADVALRMYRAMIDAAIAQQKGGV